MISLSRQGVYLLCFESQFLKLLQFFISDTIN